MIKKLVFIAVFTVPDHGLEPAKNCPGGTAKQEVTFLCTTP
jgi:hypothetical protein